MTHRAIAAIALGNLCQSGFDHRCWQPRQLRRPDRAIALRLGAMAGSTWQHAIIITLRIYLGTALRLRKRRLKPQQHRDSRASGNLL